MAREGHEVVDYDRPARTIIFYDRENDTLCTITCMTDHLFDALDHIKERPCPSGEPPPNPTP